MSIKQISVFVENKPGSMSAMTSVLAENDIDMRALSLAEASDFGIARLIVDDVFTAVQVLKEAGYVCSITKVLAVGIPDEPGALAKVISQLGENGINIEYIYAFSTTKHNLAYMIFRVKDNEKATQVLSKQGYQLASQEDLTKL